MRPRRRAAVSGQSRWIIRHVHIFRPAVVYGQCPQQGSCNRNADVVGQAYGHETQYQWFNVVPPPEILMQDEQNEDQNWDQTFQDVPFPGDHDTAQLAARTTDDTRMISSMKAPTPEDTKNADCSTPTPLHFAIVRGYVSQCLSAHAPPILANHSCARFPHSSGETSSLCVATPQVCPKGSVSLP